MPSVFLRGLSTARLSGRAQVFHDAPSKIDYLTEVSEKITGELIFYLDGAHSPESMEACARWFSDAIKVHGRPSQLATSFVLDKLNGDIHLKGKHQETDKISKQVKLP